MLSIDARLAAQAGGQGFVFGFRVPRDYFITKGWGDTSDVRSCTAHSCVAFAVKTRPCTCRSCLHAVWCQQPLAASCRQHCLGAAECARPHLHARAPLCSRDWLECCAPGQQLPLMQCTVWVTST